MRSLFETLREECSPQTWSRAVQMARSGSLSGRRGPGGSYEVRIATKGGMMSPLVSLSPADEDWSCECPSGEAVCQHVAAAAIALMQAEKEGHDPLGVKAAAARVGYRFVSEGHELSLARVLLLEAGETPLSARLTSEKQRASGDIAASRADMEIDLLVGGAPKGPLAHLLLPKLLSLLAECDDVQLDGKPVQVAEAEQALVAKVERRGAGFRVFAAQNPRLERVFHNGAALCGGKLSALSPPAMSSRDLAALREGQSFGPEELPDLVGRVVPALEDRIEVIVPEGLLPATESIAPRLSLGAEVVDGVLEVLPTIVYGDPPCARLDAGRLTYLGGALPRRDAEAEARLTRLASEKLGLELGRRKRLSGEGAVRFADQVRQTPGALVQGEALAAFAVRGALRPALQTDGERFSLRFHTEDGREADAEAVIAAYRHDSPLVPLTGGGFAPLPSDFLARHGHLVMDLLSARDADGNVAGAARLDLARLAGALDEPLPPALDGVRALLEEPELGAAPTRLPSDLTASLRDYQRVGVAWLQMLSRGQLGALLADDMGLGKTLQTLCAAGSPTLVVCPASVLFNWALEVQRFRPSLRVCTYHGASRRLDEQADVTLTTYAIARLDTDLLRARPWDTVVLDEAQTIKNPESQVAQAAFALPARFRVALTGTPVENRLTDLWSIFHFLHRGLLGGRAEFVERYEKPIADGDRAAAARLRERIRPFTLRRLKRDVAKELPPRTEVVLRATLDEAERALYDSVLAATRKEVLEDLGAGKSVLAVLEALLRLRQACCHRALLPGQTVSRSSKLDLLLETLDEAIAEGHKALVFSQWTSLLDLVEPQLTQRNLGYTRLDGSTTDRGEVVRRFQEDPAVPVMLLSLKAGGTGLNLTAADHVFLLDPWWNPAAEDQAADRAHRIGQERPVLVHRLVAADSVEERILELQERKRALSAAATGEGAMAGAVTRDDLLALLR